MNKELILVRIFGPDVPGITSRLMDVIASEQGVRVIDIGQAVTWGQLSLNILLSPNNSVLKNLLFEAKKLGMELDFEIVDAEFQKNKRSEEHIVSIIAPSEIPVSYLKSLTTLFSERKINIAKIENPSLKNLRKIEFTISQKDQSQDIDELKTEIIRISHEHKIDVSIVKNTIFRNNKRLVIFDMDSTLIQTEVIDEMAKVHGVGDEIKKITEQAMNGEIPFNESLERRLAKLRGLKTEDLDKILDQLPITDGVQEFIAIVKALGLKVGVISGGFTYFANALKDKLGLDYAFANELEMEDGALTGKVLGDVVNAERKAFLIDFIAQQEGINIQQVVAIGDGANDIPMLKKAGMGIAFHAKDIVQKQAGQNVSFGSMSSILHFLGIDEEAFL